MKLTNKHGLPEVFVRAVANDPYDSGGSDFTATSLAEPARASALKLQFKDGIEVDVSSRVASIIGQGTHSIAERAARPGIDLCEERIFASFEVDGVKYRVSCQLDLYETDSCDLYDWKTTKAYAFSKKSGGGKKPEWIQQLNVCAEILRRNQHTPKTLNIIALLKDWNKREVGSGSHPESEVVAVSLPVWSSEDVNTYVIGRIRAHIAARKELPQCTSAEHWGMRRCDQWCDASSVCKQYQDSLKTGLFLIKQ